MHNARSRKGEEQAGLGWVLGPHGMLASVIPEFEYRPAQLQMAEAVERAIDTGAPVIITGSIFVVAEAREAWFEHIGAPVPERDS